MLPLMSKCDYPHQYSFARQNCLEPIGLKSAGKQALSLPLGSGTDRHNAAIAFPLSDVIDTKTSQTAGLRPVQESEISDLLVGKSSTRSMNGRSLLMA